jgi:RNA polymerase sigma factor (sigma-70 family)
MTEDARLLSQYAKDGSQDAFRQLVIRHVDLVFASAFIRVGRDSHLAEDVTQRVFTDLARKAASLSGRQDLTGWLYTAARFVATDIVRAERRRQRREIEAQSMNENAAQSPVSENWDRIQPILTKAIDALNPLDRQAVVMRYFGHQPFAEIALRLRLSEGAAQKRVERALEALRSRLGKFGVASTSTALALALADQSIAAPTGLAIQVANVALAQIGTVSASTATAIGLIHLMTSKTTVTIATGVVLASLAGMVSEYSTVRKADQAVMTLTRQQEVLQHDISRLQTEAADDERRLAMAESSPKKRGQISGKDTPANRLESPLAYVIAHPRAREAYVNQQVLLAKARYAGFFKLAGLAPDQESRFLAVIREQVNTKLDTLDAATSQGLLDPSSSSADARGKAIAMEQLNKQGAISGDQDLHNTLGDQAYQQYRQYSATLPAQTAVGEFATQLYSTGAPLTADQSQQLTQLVAQNPFVRGQSTAVPGNSMGGVQVSDEAFAGSKVQANQQNIAWSTPITDQAVTQAESVLTPAQIGALRQFQALQLATIQAAPPHR